MKKKVIATIEARMGSSRLPGKMTLELYPGLSALGAVIERLTVCKKIDGIIVATTEEKIDDPLIDIAKKYNVAYFRGSENDVIGRVLEAGKMLNADALVLVTGDCCCISPSLLDKGVDFFLTHSYDLVSNCLEDTYPIGVDLQVVDYAALLKAYETIRQIPFCYDPNNFEHTNFFIRNHPEIFSIYRYPASQKYNRPDIRLALDTKIDLEIIRNIYLHLYPMNKFFDLDDILDLLNKEPKILAPLKGTEIDRTGIKND